MNSRVYKFSFLSHRILLMILYAVFFLVQFSCITGPDNISVAVNSLSYHKSTDKEKSFTAKNDHSKKTKIRLNKRFHPVISEDITNPLPEAPVKYVTRNNLSKPNDYLLISFILAASLRGPPSLS
ncbi:MAG: hypothetical protein JSS70_08150 [Bacteroidetes bacterium]|nr:hypothetical protein [Bacteroidota bacterium]